MSLLSLDRVRIALAPDKVAVLLETRGRRPKVVAKAVWHCQPAPSDGNSWHAAARVLAQGLVQLKATGMETTAILSNHFVRYAVLPWSGNIASPEERMAMARIIFERDFGTAAGGWSIRVDGGGYGQACLASAVDASLPESISDICAAAGVRLASVQPYLMSVFNQYRRRLRVQGFCLVVAERGKACILMGRQGEWHAIRSLVLRDHPGQDLLSLVRREILVTGLPVPAQIYLHAPGEPAVAQAVPQEADVETLELPARADFSAHPAGDYGMAMSGVP